MRLASLRQIKRDRCRISRSIGIDPYSSDLRFPSCCLVVDVQLAPKNASDGMLRTKAPSRVPSGSGARTCPEPDKAKDPLCLEKQKALGLEGLSKSWGLAS